MKIRSFWLKWRWPTSQHAYSQTPVLISQISDFILGSAIILRQSSQLQFLTCTDRLDQKNLNKTCVRKSPNTAYSRADLWLCSSRTITVADQFGVHRDGRSGPNVDSSLRDGLLIHTVTKFTVLEDTPDFRLHQFILRHITPLKQIDLNFTVVVDTKPPGFSQDA